MLKGLWRRLLAGGKSDSGNPEASATPVAAAPPADAHQPDGKPPAVEPSPMVSVVDEFGRQFEIPRETWRQQVLAPNLAKNADDPEGLYGLIVSAMNDGLFEDVEAASARLLAIDPVAERSHTIRGIVLMQLGRLAEAEIVLREGMRRAGETGTLLTNLAKVCDRSGNEAAADAILERAIARDPNQENGLLWWLARARERGGEPAWDAGLARAAAIPGAWRPQLWQALALVKQNRVDEAVAIYRELLARDVVHSDVLFSISGDLGNAGRIDLVFSLVAGRYDPAHHDVRIGLNLLQACLQAELVDDGLAWLKRMYALQNPAIKQHLDRFAAGFDEILAKRPLAQADIGEPRVENMMLASPIWQYGMDDPRWLFADKPEDAPRVLFYVPSVSGRAHDPAGTQREDTAGRLSRAVPLYLAECVHERTTLIGTTLLPVVKGTGPAVFGAGHDMDTLLDALAEHGAWLVTGRIDENAEMFTLVLGAWDVAQRTCIATREATFSVQDPASFGAAVRALEDWLLGVLGHALAGGTTLDPWYARVPDAWLPTYLLCLNQSLMLSLVSNGVAERGSLHGERDILERPFMLAAEFPDAGQTRMLALSALAKTRRNGSDLMPEFTRRVEVMMNKGLTPEIRAALEPLVHFVNADDAALEQACAGQPARDDEAYRVWLRKLLHSAVGGTANTLQ